MRILELSRRRALTSCLWAAAASLSPGLPALAAGGPSSLSGKPRPETGVCLLDPVEQSGNSVSAELLLNTKDAGVSVVTAFESPYPVAKGNYYDIEARNKDGDAAFVHVATLPAGMRIETAPVSFFTDTALGPTGRFGSYSAPQITGVTGGKLGGATAPELSSGTRFFDVSFNTLTQSGFEAPRRGVIAALQPTESMDVLMLVCTVSASKWKKGGEADVRRTAESFRVTRTRPSRLLRGSDNDYRYQARSLKGFSEGESEIDAALARDLSTQSGSLGGKFGAAAVTQGYQYQNARGK